MYIIQQYRQVHPLQFSSASSSLFTLTPVQSFISIQQTSPSDISHEILMGPASRALKTTDLSKFKGKVPTEFSGVLFGINKRPLVVMPVKLAHQSCTTFINVIFKVDPASSTSSLTVSALNKVFKSCPKIKLTFQYSYKVMIAGHEIDLNQAQVYDSTVNILGMNFLQKTNSYVLIDQKYIQEGHSKLFYQTVQLIIKRMQKIQNYYESI